MFEKIGNVNINYSFYQGEDRYSDGEIENEILQIVKKYDSFTEVIAQDNRWPILYHLSPERRNLLEWIEFDKEDAVLEIGAGCGALTGVLCEKAESVVAVELSRRRAEIIAHRYKSFKNLEIYVGDLNDIVIDKKFDFITLIGVLEYAGQFTQTSSPHKDFLTTILRFLKPGGTLIIAIENKFGLKYWAGASEDHTGKIFESLEDYPKNDKVYTFGKDELTYLLRKCGFYDINYYYPYPDYKLPLQIFSDDWLPRSVDIDGFCPNYDRERLSLFNEQKTLKSLIKNRKFDFFSNSFLITCKNKK